MVDSFIFYIKAYGRNCHWQVLWILFEAKKGKIMSELRFEWKNMLAADLGEESCVPDLLGERILQNSLKFYLDETDEIYEGYGKVADSYPYRQRNNYKRQLKEKQIRTAVLENNQLKAVFFQIMVEDYGNFGIKMKTGICFIRMTYYSSVTWRYEMPGFREAWNGILAL